MVTDAMIRFLRLTGPGDVTRLLEGAGAPGTDGSWLVLGISYRPTWRAEATPGEADAGAVELRSLAELLATSPDLVVVLEPGMAPRCRGSLGAWVREADRAGGLLMLLVRWAEPPVARARFDGPVRSFIGPASVLSGLGNDPDRVPVERLCYAALGAAFSRLVRRVAVRQVGGGGSGDPLVAAEPTTAVILPHRGPPDDLRTALHFLAHSGSERVTVRVGLDVEDVATYERVAAEHPRAEFFRAEPAPVGPYVIRQGLAVASREDALAFHDSDDVSCADRFPRLLDEVARTGCELVGSHELRYDQLSGEVTAVRFPLDASAALRGGAFHALLHPTSLVLRPGFFRAGGLSTDRRFANDTQFLLRAYFRLRIRNVDDFLYVRRRREGSLTTSPETGMHSPARVQLIRDWAADFEAVKAGRLRLEESRLAASPGLARPQVRRLGADLSRP